MQIVPVQPHSKTTDVDTDQGYTIVIMGEENSQAMVENVEELKEARDKEAILMYSDIYNYQSKCYKLIFYCCLLIFKPKC